MKRLFIFGVCALVVLCMASCYPEGPDYFYLIYFAYFIY